MEKSTMYRTDNYHLACFLLGRGAKFIGVEKGEEKDSQNIALPDKEPVRRNWVDFLFEVPPEMNLAKILVWWSSKDADDVKSILYATKPIKKALSFYLKELASK